ncbi:MAG TPA: FMN-binding negative transcriptional regulator [Actinocrinis sp.]|uniref:FMN-binding negative transcriptional regulator n=1 Tax=Actinocrinis sp. TaxID=1920516 RepID=UPI002DDCC57C|nr:FMN-binding negative transcriptional regulator [Actinocrinis sp.]HEV2345418.1 FMN-binding negative transcriptional regulator [Actinocrinis sp.]
MYVPKLYQPANTAVMHELIEAHPFGTLTVAGDEGLDAVHIPFVLDREVGRYGRLRAHLALANPITGMMERGIKAMVIFRGPHSYIRPADYGNEPHFPTWNYAAVHVHGVPRILDRPSSARQVADLIADQEHRLAPDPAWTLDQVTTELFEEYFQRVVGFELDITRIEGIFKLGQNKEDHEMDSLVATLRRSGEPGAARMAELLERRFDPRFPVHGRAGDSVAAVGSAPGDAATVADPQSDPQSGPEPTPKPEELS